MFDKVSITFAIIVSVIAIFLSDLGSASFYYFSLVTLILCYFWDKKDW